MPIETPEEFSEWLEEQPHETCLLIAVRAALRVFPIAIHTYKVGAENERVALLIARALLTAGVASVLKSRAISLASKAAENAADQGADASHEAGMATISAVTAASSTSSSRIAEANFAVEYSIDATLNVTRLENNATREKSAQVTRTAAYSDAEIPFTSLLKIPVWHEPEEPDWLATYLKSSIRLLESGSNWPFWREWYQGFVDGNPMDWELQRRVALIADPIWEVGPEAVSEEIERIRAHYTLEREIARLKKQLRSSATLEANADRLHNQPPVAIEDEAKAAGNEIKLIWDELVELEAEIAKPEPSPGKLRQIAQALWDVSVRIGKYCGSVADIVIKESAKELGKTGTKVTVAALAATTAAQNESIQSVARAIWNFVKTLPPG